MYGAHTRQTNTTKKTREQRRKNREHAKESACITAGFILFQFFSVRFATKRCNVNDDRWRNVSIENEMALHFKRQQFELNVDFNDFKASWYFTLTHTRYMPTDHSQDSFCQNFVDHFSL